jgi:hypothetical protein
LSPDERWLLAQALVLLPLTFAGVYTLGVSRWQRVLARVMLRRGDSGFDAHLPGKSSTVLSDSQATAQRARLIARLVKTAAQHGLYHATCLPQSLVLWTLLSRNGVDSQIRFGARKEEGQLQAHAWVECFGIALNEEGDVHQRFPPLEELTASTIN